MKQNSGGERIAFKRRKKILQVESSEVLLPACKETCGFVCFLLKGKKKKKKELLFAIWAYLFKNEELAHLCGTEMTFLTVPVLLQWDGERQQGLDGRATGQ